MELQETMRLVPHHRPTEAPNPLITRTIDKRLQRKVNARDKVWSSSSKPTPPESDKHSFDEARSEPLPDALAAPLPIDLRPRLGASARVVDATVEAEP